MTILISLLGTKAFGLMVYMWQAAEATPAPTPGVNHFSPMAMVKSMGAVAIGVVIVLLIMSVYSIAIMVERYLTYTAAKKQSREFAPRVAQALKNDRIEEAINISDKHRKSHLAMVVSSGLQEFRAHESWDCLVRCSELLMRSAPWATPARRVSAPSPVVFLRRSLPPLWDCSSPFRPFGCSTISRERWMDSSSRWTIQLPNWLITLSRTARSS